MSNRAAKHRPDVQSMTLRGLLVGSSVVHLLTHGVWPLL